MCDAQVLAAAHECVALGSLAGRGYAVGVKVLLLAACRGDEAVVASVRQRKWRTKERQGDSPTKTDQSPLARDNLGAYVGLAARCQPPASGSKGSVEYSAVLDLGQVDESVWQGGHHVSLHDPRIFS